MRYLIFILISPFLLAATGCPNAFVESANKTSDDAYAFSAEQHANAREWSSAINDMGKMSAAGKAKRENKQSLGSYYGGRCGLSLLDLAQSMKDNSSLTMWPIMMKYMKTAGVIEAADCKLGEQTILGIDSVATNRNANENVLLAFVEFSKMGASLASSTADANDDGTIDVGFDPCSPVAISDASIGELGTGLTIAASALSASDFAASGVKDVVANLCTTMETYQAGFCNTTDPSTFNSTALKAIRSLIKSDEIGFNTCGGHIGSSGACICP